jgi:hypothetical protein
LIRAAGSALGRRRWIANAALAAGLLLCAALYVWPPSGESLYPVCPVRQYLHIDCPGCGATRALAALLRGQLLDALRLNALFVLLLPFGLAIGLECYRRAMRLGEFSWPEIPRPVMYAGLAVAAMFMVARNL